MIFQDIYLETSFMSLKCVAYLLHFFFLLFFGLFILTLYVLFLFVNNFAENIKVLFVSAFVHVPFLFHVICLCLISHRWYLHHLSFFFYRFYCSNICLERKFSQTAIFKSSHWRICFIIDLQFLRISCLLCGRVGAFDSLISPVLFFHKNKLCVSVCVFVFYCTGYRHESVSSSLSVLTANLAPDPVWPPASSSAPAAAAGLAPGRD